MKEKIRTVWLKKDILARLKKGKGIPGTGTVTLTADYGPEEKAGIRISGSGSPADTNTLKIEAVLYINGQLAARSGADCFLDIWELVSGGTMYVIYIREDPGIHLFCRNTWDSTLTFDRKKDAERLVSQFLGTGQASKRMYDIVRTAKAGGMDANDLAELIVSEAELALDSFGCIGLKTISYPVYSEQDVLTEENNRRLVLGIIGEISGPGHIIYYERDSAAREDTPILKGYLFENGSLTDKVPVIRWESPDQLARRYTQELHQITAKYPRLQT